MYPPDEGKIAFITPHGLYNYKVMSFGLKKAGATYQRLMTKIFKPLIGRTIEVYIDDIVVKSRTKGEHDQHLEEVFHLLREYDMKLNPSNCAFGVSVEKFLGFMVTQRSIEANPNQIKSNQSCHRDIRPTQQKGVAMPHWQTRCTRMLYNPVYKQTKAFFPCIKKSQRDMMEGRLSVCI